MNIRQSGRRRGRNNRPQNGLRGNDGNSRIDSRARGNATQLLEKYKNLAREAQLQGDRVMTEYYHQFADHYFRVLSEHRARQEDYQAQQRARYGHDEGSQIDGSDPEMVDADLGDEDGHGFGDGDDDADNGVGAQAVGRDGGAANGAAQRRQERGGNGRDDRARDERARDERGRSARPNGGPAGRRPRQQEAADEGEDGLALDASILPPAIGAGDGSAGADAGPDGGPVSGNDAGAAPRKPRARRPRVAEPAPEA